MTIEWCGLMNGQARAIGQFHSPLGPCMVTGGPKGVVAVDWVSRDDMADYFSRKTLEPVPEDEETSKIMEQVSEAVHMVSEMLNQLEEYFAGKRQQFTVPLTLERGTDFQKAVWDYLLQIPYGETRSYGEVAHAIGRDKAVRAVGQANRNNPIPIVIPCHRVIGSSGALTGYAGSQVHLKAALLELERGQAMTELAVTNQEK